MTQLPRHQYFFCVMFVAGLVLCSMPWDSQATTPTASDSRQTALDIPKAPQSPGAAPHHSIVFIRNDGQVDPSVAYHVKGMRHDYFFASDSVKIPVPGPKGGRSRIVSLHPLWLDQTAAIVPGRQSPTHFNFYTGQEQSNWRTKVPAYESLTYRHAATGIDLVWYVRGQELEYDVVLPAGVEPGKARFRVEGARTVRLDKQGALVVETADGGRLIQAPPRLHQVVDGQDIPVKGRFADVRKSPDGWSYGFVAAAYDRSRPLVIDPTLTFGVPLSGNGTETINAITVSSAGDTYVCGSTTSTDLGTVTHPVQLNDAFISRYDTGGNPMWTSYVGGTKDEFANAMAIVPTTVPPTANAGNIVIVGQTNSPSGVPITNDAFNKGLHGSSIDAFLAIFDPTLGNIVYCSYFGGSGSDIARGVAVDASGVISIAGSTDSPDLPTTSALYPSRVSGTDGFIAKFSATGAYLHSLTYFGGTGTDIIHAIAVDSQGNSYVAGETTSPVTSTSTSFPVKNAIIASRPGTTSGFVAKINPSGSGLVYSTYLGGKAVDSVRALALDSSRNVYLTGTTTSSDFPVTNALYPTLAGDSDAFAAKLDASGRFLWYSTFLGGGDTDVGLGVAVDQGTGAAYFTGTTESANFPVVDLLQFTAGVLYTFGTGLGGSTDAFITKIDAAGSQAVYSNYLGGLGADEGHAVAVDPSTANVSITVGSTIYASAKPIFPYRPAIVPSNPRKHGFLTKITDTGSPPANYPVLSLDRPSARSGQQVTLTLALANATTTGVGALATNLVYDTAVLANPVVTFDTRLKNTFKKSSVSTALSSNTLRLSVYSDPASATAPLVITAGTIATVRFDILNDVSSQFSGVTLASTASTAGGADIQISSVNGGVQIRQRCGILGDCDCSGAVELWELQNALNIYLSPLVPPFCMVTDYSTTITAADLTTIINNYATPSSGAAIAGVADTPFTRQADAGAMAGLRLGTAEKRSDGWYVPVIYTAAKGTATSAVATRIGYDATAYASADAIIGAAALEAGKELLINAKTPGKLALMAISTANAAAIGDGTLAWLRLVPAVGTSSQLTALTQAGDAATSQGEAVAVQSTGKAALEPPRGVGAALGLLLQ